MGPWYYEVVSFDGDYVNLRRTDIASDELNPVALALLPPEIEEEGRCPEDPRFFLWNRRIATGGGKCYNKTRCVCAHKNKKEETAALWNNFI